MAEGVWSQCLQGSRDCVSRGFWLPSQEVLVPLAKVLIHECHAVHHTACVYVAEACEPWENHPSNLGM